MRTAARTPPPALRRPHSAAPSEGSYRRNTYRMSSFG